MAILNYTTKIDAFKTVGEIQAKLAAFDAQAVMLEYQKQLPVAISFKLLVFGKVAEFRLPCNHMKLFLRLQKQNVPKKLQTEEQALRVAWRILKNWIDAQVELISSDMVSVPELFMAHLVLENGKTLYQGFEENGHKLLKQ